MIAMSSAALSLPLSPPLGFVRPAFLPSDGISLEVPVQAPQLRLISFIVQRRTKGKKCFRLCVWLDECGSVETRQAYTDKYLTSSTRGRIEPLHGKKKC